MAEKYWKFEKYGSLERMTKFPKKLPLVIAKHLEQRKKIHQYFIFMFANNKMQTSEKNLKRLAS